MTAPILTPAKEDAADIIQQEAAAVAAAFGVADAPGLAAAILDRLRLRMGGGALYLPTGAAAAARQRRERIRAEYTGNNIPALARKHGVSERWVRKIVAAKK